MAITQADILKYAFAEQGDKTEISVDTDPKGNVSWQQGFPNDYSRNPEQDGKYILRDNFNYIVNLVTQGLKDLQINGGRLWNQQSANLIGGYPMGARVMVHYNNFTNEITEQPLISSEGIALSSTIILVSMKENNLDSPLVAENLFKSWWIDDGVDMFGLKISTQNPTSQRAKVPSGYLDLGAADVTTKQYAYTDYPRVKYFKDNGGMPDYFKDNGNNTFSIEDIRGRFFRLFSNGGTIDSGRDFKTLQGDAIRNITGKTSGDRLGQDVRTLTQGALDMELGGENGAAADVGSNELTIVFNASKVVSTALENRPYNFNLKIYIKV